MSALHSNAGTGVGPSREPRLREEDGKASSTSGTTHSSRTAADPGNAASVPSSQDRSTPLESVECVCHRFIRSRAGDCPVHGHVPFEPPRCSDAWEADRAERARPADRVDELEARDWETRHVLEYARSILSALAEERSPMSSPAAAVEHIDAVLARQSLSTQPHQDKTP